jgi:deoxyribodipyrimidine photo-lyase
MYNPTKQAKDNDPDGTFIRRWLPELKDVPSIFIHSPWKMTAMDQAFSGVTIGENYPKPIVDLKESAKVARDKIWGHRKNTLVRQEQKRIIKFHVINQNRRV